MLFAEEAYSDVVREVERLAGVSAALRKDRELSFYGDIDFIPTEHYTREHPQRALDDASWVVSVAATVTARTPVAGRRPSRMSQPFGSRTSLQ